MLVWYSAIAVRVTAHQPRRATPTRNPGTTIAACFHVRHVVSFRVKDEVGEAGRALLLDTMRAMLEGEELKKLVKASTVGIDLGIPHPSGAKNAFVADVVDFASQADYETYATHPDHLGVIKSIVPVIEPGSRSAIQFNIPQAGVVS